MKYIELLREGERVSEVYLCKYKQSALTKTGKQYENIILQDKTGTMDAKIWDPASPGIDDFAVMDYIEVSGDVLNFQGSMQMSIKRVRKIPVNQVNQADYLPVSSQDTGKMYEELLAYVQSVQNPHYRKLLEVFFRNEAFARRFKFHSAAKNVHHGFVGGLLEHTLGVARNCDYFSKAYPMLNRDLLLTAAMFHDVGKLKELSTFPENDYTDEGQLLGHIMIGAEMIAEKIHTMPDFPKTQEYELLHCILAHHGELEFGSPKKPALAEALALSFADNLDAKMETVKEMLSGVPDGNLQWQGFNRLLDSNFRRTSTQ